MSHLQPLSQTDFTADKAAHLLRRTLSGVRPQELILSLRIGLSATLQKLFTPYEPDTRFIDDLRSSVGVVSGVQPIDSPEYAAFFQKKEWAYVRTKQWWYKDIVRSPMSIQPRLVLFWHHLMPVSFGGAHYAEHVIDYVDTIRANIFGTVPDLVHAVTHSLAMQIYLDGVNNQWYEWFDGTNENHARELLELHTLGRFDLQGTQPYTQEDISMISRALSGWRIHEVWDESNPDAHVLIRERIPHMRTSAHYPHTTTIFGESGVHTSADVIKRIYEKRSRAAAQHVCRRLYIWFVSETVNSSVVEEMAEHLIANGWELAATLRALLESEHFYDPGHRMNLVRSPIDVVCGSLRMIEPQYVPDFDDIPVGEPQEDLTFRLTQMGHVVGRPPNVSGWPHGRGWLTTSSVHQRTEFLKGLGNGTHVYRKYNGGRPVYTFNIVDFMKSCQFPENIDQALETLSIIMFGSSDFSTRLSERIFRDVPPHHWPSLTDEQQQFVLHSAFADFFSSPRFQYL